MHTCHGMLMEVREQLAGVNSLLPPCGFRDQTQDMGLAMSRMNIYNKYHVHDAVFKAVQVWSNLGRRCKRL